ncbi:hypothetical protein EVA_07050 [gut metagenome]|uniref:Uncharacterized protein n=1 Tax=gut metagenome TaxID=749906 RepID=J9CX56_9ZZZZ
MERAEVGHQMMATKRVRTLTIKSLIIRCTARYYGCVSRLNIAYLCNVLPKPQSK